MTYSACKQGKVMLDDDDMPLLRYDLIFGMLPAG